MRPSAARCKCRRNSINVACTPGQRHRAQALPFFTYVQYAIIALAAADFVYDPSRGTDIGQHMRIQMLDLADGR